MSEQRWIPVSERLPEAGASVLIFHRVTDPDGTPSCIGADGNGGIIDTAMLDVIEGDHVWLASEHGHVAATHWMPLPEPPKVKS